jgi:hypothetical protein
MATWWPRARGMELRPLCLTSAALLRATQRRAWGRGRSASTRRPLTSPTHKRSSSCGRSSAATTLRSTGR